MTDLGNLGGDVGEEDGCQRPKKTRVGRRHRVQRLERPCHAINRPNRHVVCQRVAGTHRQQRFKLRQVVLRNVARDNNLGAHCKRPCNWKGQPVECACLRPSQGDDRKPPHHPIAQRSNAQHKPYGWTRIRRRGKGGEPQRPRHVSCAATGRRRRSGAPAAAPPAPDRSARGAPQSHRRVSAKGGGEGQAV